MFVAFLIVTLVILISTCLPFFRREVWWVRGFDFPRLQIFLLAIATLFLMSFYLDPSEPIHLVLYLLVIACAAIQAWWIIPYTPFFPVEVKAAAGKDDQNRIKIMVANVLTPNRNAKALIELIGDNSPDILVTLESDKWWQEQLEGLEAEYRYSMKCPLDNLYGMHVYSRLELTNTEIEYLVEEGVPSMHALIYMRSGTRIRAHFLHPSPPAPNENEQSTERDAELITVARSVADTDAPVIVTGDLNDVAWSSTTRLFRKISGLLDPRVGRGMYNSFNAKYPFLRFPLDHLFHSDHFRVVSLNRLPKFGSDHFAILFELEFCEDRDAGESNLTAKKYDYDLAKEKSAKKNMKKEDVPVPED